VLSRAASPLHVSLVMVVLLEVHKKAQACTPTHSTTVSPKSSQKSNVKHHVIYQLVVSVRRPTGRRFGVALAESMKVASRSNKQQAHRRDHQPYVQHWRFLGEINVHSSPYVQRYRLVKPAHALQSPSPLHLGHSLRAAVRVHATTADVYDSCRMVSK